MKNLLQILLVFFLWLNGIMAAVYGLKVIRSLHYSAWFDDLLLPGILLLILAGAGGLVVTFFVKKKPFLLIFAALIEGMCLIFALAGQQGTAYHLQGPYLLLGAEGLILIIVAIALMVVAPSKANTL